MSAPREPPLLPPAGEEEQVYFQSYVPPARDAIHLPIHVFYMILASIIIVATLYAIIGHLIKDLMHDLAGEATANTHETLSLINDSIL